MDGLRQPRTADHVLVETEGRRSAERRCRCARARSVTELVALGEDSSQVTVNVRLEVQQGLARQIVLTMPDGVVVNQVTGATVSTGTSIDATLTVTFLEPGRPRRRSSSPPRRARRARARSRYPLVRVPSAERETGGVAVDVVGPGEIARAEPRGLEPADALDLGDIVAGRESPSMVAFQLHAARGQRAARRSPSTSSRYTRRRCSSPTSRKRATTRSSAKTASCWCGRDTPCATTSAASWRSSLPPRQHAVERGARGPPDSSGTSARRQHCCCRCERARREGGADVHRRAACTCRAARVVRKGDAHVELPAVDLPVSRTGLTLHSLAAVSGGNEAGRVPRRERRVRGAPRFVDRRRPRRRTAAAPAPGPKAR